MEPVRHGQDGEVVEGEEAADEPAVGRGVHRGEDAHDGHPPRPRAGPAGSSSRLTSVAVCSMPARETAVP